MDEREWVAATVRDGGDVARAAAYKAGRGRCVGMEWTVEWGGGRRARQMEMRMGMDGRTVEKAWPRPRLALLRRVCPAPRAAPALAHVGEEPGAR